MGVTRKNNLGEIVTKDTSPQRKESIEKWTDVMLIFVAKYLQAHPAKTTELMKYIQTVRMGANRGYQWWYDYDIQFRLRKATNPSGSWGDIDSELWFMHMTPSPSGGITQSPKHVQMGKCYDYNFKVSCSKYPCSYGHICLKCKDSI